MQKASFDGRFKLNHIKKRSTGETWSRAYASVKPEFKLQWVSKLKKQVILKLKLGWDLRIDRMHRTWQWIPKLCISQSGHPLAQHCPDVGQKSQVESNIFWYMPCTIFVYVISLSHLQLCTSLGHPTAHTSTLYLFINRWYNYPSVGGCTVKLLNHSNTSFS